MKICTGDGSGGGGGGVGPDDFSIDPPLNPGAATSYDVHFRAHYGKAELRISQGDPPNPAGPPQLLVNKGVVVGVFVAVPGAGEIFVSVDTPDDPKVGYHWMLVEQ